MDVRKRCLAPCQLPQHEAPPEHQATVLHEAQSLHSQCNDQVLGSNMVTHGDTIEQ